MRWINNYIDNMIEELLKEENDILKDLFELNLIIYKLSLYDENKREHAIEIISREIEDYFKGE